VPSQNKIIGRTPTASLQLEVLAIFLYTGSASKITAHFWAFQQASCILVYAYVMLMQHIHECKFHRAAGQKKLLQAGKQR